MRIMVHISSMRTDRLILTIFFFLISFVSMVSSQECKKILSIEYLGRKKEEEEEEEEEEAPR